MLLVPQKGGLLPFGNGAFGGTTTPGTAVPANAISLSYGTITELVSAAGMSDNVWGLHLAIFATGASATAGEASIDILAGASTEDVLISSLLCGYSVGAGVGAGYQYLFPLMIPGGTRLSARLASVRTGISAQVLVTLFRGGVPPWRVGRKVTTYGTKINNARGQSVTPTASAGAASVTQMTASSAEDHFAFLPGFQAATDTTITPAGFVNIGIGVGAATEDRIGTWYFKKDTGEDMGGPIPAFPCFRDVPAGTRLSLLASNSGANDAAYDGLIYAVS